MKLQVCMLFLQRLQSRGKLMLEVLNKHLKGNHSVCSVALWMSSLDKEEQEAFILLKDNNEKVNVSELYGDLADTTDLPFKTTTFRAHLRGYCVCPKN